MKNKVLALLLMGMQSVIVCSCTTSGLQFEIDQIAKDKVVTQKEFTALQSSVAKNSKFDKYKSSEELHRYLIKYFAAKKLVVDVWNPKRKVTAKFNVNVFFENSSSMDGYISQADMKSSIYDLLVNVKQIGVSISLNYINSKVIREPSNDIKSFSIKLTPAKFKSMGGTRGTSDIAEVLKNVLYLTDKGTASILISDFVFSPTKHQNAVSYLNLQEISVKDEFLNKLKEQNLAVAIFQMKAYFQGVYYDHNSRKIKLMGVNRPYYIWFIGTEDQVQQALTNQIVNRNDPHLLNTVVISTTSKLVSVKYKIVNKGKIGNYTFKMSDEISNASAANGEFGFGLAVRFADHLKELAYFSEQKIYQPSNSDYSITVRILTPTELNSPSYSGYTHLLGIKTKKVQNEELKIRVIDQLPAWVAASSSINDEQIEVDTLEQGKTFGLSHLVNGVSRAFGPQNTNIISEIKIKIEK